ncbi:hypothetical protein [Streptacidiphilus anmyonensis]|uniref:hypothetical protein n=1 Tax=Streptacidiphilus anmyonensis TaxID=405782 RepID=UPI0005A9CA66|nr:hypothetical protein [Streptacidiphilus anmyonensis]
MPTALPIRIPQATGHVSASPRMAPAYPGGRYACEVDPDSEHPVIHEPNRRWCAVRAEFLVGVAKGVEWTRKRRAAEADGVRP